MQFTCSASQSQSPQHQNGAAIPGPLPAVPAQELRAIHEQAARNGWPPAAYLEVARWCRRHRPQFERLWLNLAMGVQL